MEYIDLGLKVLGGLCVVATMIAKITPTQKDDKIVSKAVGFLQGVVAYLPTLGKNPATKQIEESFNKLKVEKKEILSETIIKDA